VDFDEMFEAWRAQNTAPPYDVNRDALRQAIQDEETRVRGEMRTHRGSLWFGGIVAIGMAIFAGFWIAISIANGWSAIYVMTSALSFGLFAVGTGGLWVLRRAHTQPERNFGNTLEEDLRRTLALVDYQLSLFRHQGIPFLAVICILAGSWLFSWTVRRSQDVPDSSHGPWWTILLIAFFAWAFRKGRDDMRETKSKLELRQRHLRELLTALETRD
jgi:UDP-N-acetylmuramyl pentapeptide phosphotransferase/UDP-N-acetylglucosamine-1-phosphate transferase